MPARRSQTSSAWPGWTGTSVARLAEADRLNRTVVDLNRAGKYAEAVPAAGGQALAIRKAALGRPPPTPPQPEQPGGAAQRRGTTPPPAPHEQALASAEAGRATRHRPSLNNLAAATAQGDYAAAKPLYEQALAIRKAGAGRAPPRHRHQPEQPGGAAQAQGDYAAAKPLYEQALAIRKAVLGERHPDTATSLNNLAELLQAQGDYAAAKPLYEQALAIRKAVLGERHPDTAPA